jgi:sec-independent protein translocase protein TatA
MGGMSIWHWIVVGVVVMLLFGRGKISEIMGDAAKGIKAFKKGMSDDSDEKAKEVAAAQAIPPAVANGAPAAPANTAATPTPAPAASGQKPAV